MFDASFAKVGQFEISSAKLSSESVYPSWTLVALVIARKTFTITNLPMNLMRIEGILLAVRIIVQLGQYLPIIRPYTTMGYIPSFHAIPTKTLSLRNFKSAKW